MQGLVGYQRAVNEAGYGLFNILLLLASLPVAWTTILDSTSSAFILQATECVFQLTWFRKGLMVAMPHIGMATVGPIWDLFFKEKLTNRFGKRNIMIAAMCFDVVLNFSWIHTSSYFTFIVLKFINGALISGPLSLMVPYLDEFQAPKYKNTFKTWSSLAFSVSNIFAPGLAVFFSITRGPCIEIPILDSISYDCYESWRIYLLVCTIPPVMGLLSLCLLPNDPNYLRRHDQTEELLRLMKQMYWFNKFGSSDSYPFSEISLKQDDKLTENNFNWQNVTKSFKLLLSKTYISSFAIILILQFITMVGFNTMRLWVPQTFMVLNNFHTLLLPKYKGNGTITMCTMLFSGIPFDNQDLCTYTEPDLEAAVYINSTIIATSAVTFAFIFGLITGSGLRKKLAIIVLLFLSSIGAFAANWSVEIPYMLIFCSLIICSSRISANLVSAQSNYLVPQNLRPTMTFANNIVGNAGAAIGCIMYSVLIEINCVATFIGLGAITIGSAFLAILLRRSPIDSFKPQKTPIVEIYSITEPKY